MKPTNIVTFGRSAAKFMAETFGFKVNGIGIYSKYPSERMTCNTCGRMLTIKNIGNFAKGKTVKVELYCDNPICLATWIACNKLEDSPKKKK